MVTGASPGKLGIYGFKNRVDHSYHRRALPSSLSVPLPTLWQLTSEHNLRNKILTVPQTYPARPLKGQLVAGFPIPDMNGPVSYPRNLWGALQNEVPSFQIDLEDFRHTHPSQVYTDVIEMTHSRFKVAERWLKASDWDFFMMVEMGPDRLHHALWSFCDPQHPSFDPQHPLATAIEDYYKLLDKKLKALLSSLSKDDLLLVVSDHGAQRMTGGLALNQWLVDEGYLTLSNSHPKKGPLLLEQVDWTNTRAWADGGYVGRIYFNIKGREPKGSVPQEQIESLTREITTKLNKLRGEQNEDLLIETLNPEQAYGSDRRGVPPDLTLLIQNMSYRVLGTLGHPKYMTRENDTGSDGANHARDGIVIATGPKILPAHRLDLSIYDIAPTVLRHLKVPLPAYMKGIPIECNRIEKPFIGTDSQQVAVQLALP